MTGMPALIWQASDFIISLYNQTLSGEQLTREPDAFAERAATSTCVLTHFPIFQGAD
jgi:hypothetical protein